MDRILYEILENLDEGIIILNADQEIAFWSGNLEFLLRIQKDAAQGRPITSVLPGFQQEYLQKMLQDVLCSGHRVFLSAAMHRDLLDTDKKLNLKITRIEKNGRQFVMIEFIDVTNQFVRIVQLQQVVKQLRAKESTIHRLAYHDNLTGLSNRALFYKVASKLCDNALRSQSMMGFMFIDVDHFKRINDTYGHTRGDEVLVVVADVLRKCIRRGDMAARFGGDEFMVLLASIRHREDCGQVADRIRNMLRRRTQAQLDFSVSIGISFMPDDGQTIDQLTVQADRAMYDVKKNGGDDYRFTELLCT